jgi:hypothetical protein
LRRHLTNPFHWLRRSNASLLQDACRHPGGNRFSGPTAYQAELVNQGKSDSLFLENYLIEKECENLPHLVTHIVRHLPTGAVLRMRTFASELSLDCDGYHAITKTVLASHSKDIIRPTLIKIIGGKLRVIREHVTGESFEQIGERLGPLAAEDAIGLVILLLRRLSELKDCRIICICPSQVVVTSGQEIKLVDLDETEVVFLKRNVKLRASNALVLSGYHKLFLAPEVLHRTNFDTQKAVIFSIGRNLEFLLGKYRKAVDRAFEGISQSDSLLDVIAAFTHPDPAEREPSYESALRRLRLALQPIPRKESFSVQSEQIDTSNRPAIRVVSTRRAIFLALFAIAIPSMIGYSSFLILRSDSLPDKRSRDLPASDTTIRSDSVFQIE